MNDRLEQAKNRAFRFLTARRRTYKQVADKLAECEFEQEIIDEVMWIVEKHNFVNDFEFARDYIADATRLKKHSRKKIRFDLLKKGICKAMLDEVFAQFPADELPIVIEIIEKKVSKIEVIDFKAKQKIFAHLSGKGFSYDVINAGFETLGL